MTWTAKHWSKAELCHSTQGEAAGIANIPNAQQTANLEWFSANVLDPVSAALGVVCDSSSGFRNDAVNELVGGELKSKHKEGLADDLIPRGLNLLDAAKKIIAAGVPFDQLIIECRIDKKGRYREWLHISGDPTAATPRREVLYFPLRKPYIAGLPSRWPL